MENLNFYTVPLDYVEYLQKAELHKRGFTRVPNLEYGKERNQKFLCGIVLRINEMDYYVPVSSYKIQKADNFLICEKDGHAVSSLRFNYMFPVPRNLVKVRRIFLEPVKNIGLCLPWNCATVFAIMMKFAAWHKEHIGVFCRPKIRARPQQL